MKKIFYLIFLFAVLQACKSEKTSVMVDNVSIIPMPKTMEIGAGYYDVNVSSDIYINDNKLKEIQAFLQKGVKNYTTWDLKSSQNKEASISLILDTSIANAKTESYSLLINEKGIVISASTEAGIFYGVQSFLQLLPLDAKENVRLPFVSIQDEPIFAYRGMHLDVGRHIYTVDFIKKYIDMMAMYKMNTFHWHLTEDQGWRIEIKKYPKLTEVSSFRKDSDGNIYGGFYTQEEVKELIAYAEARFITIIPEIEMPGHSVAVLAAYPNLACTDGPFEVMSQWGVHEDVYCAGNEETFEFLENVLLEVIELFPSKYIHIGGDECPKSRWEKCKKCQKRIKDNKLKDEHELQSWFIKRMEKFLNKHGRQIIGWDEILEGGLAPGATVMSWRGIDGGIQAAKEGHDVIMTPTSYCYFDYYQGNPLFEPKAIGGYLSLEKVYSYQPIPHVLTPQQAKHILGAQGNVWTEYLPDEKDVEYMMMPRMMALSEVLWSDSVNRDYENFTERFEAHRPKLDMMDVNYSRSIYQVSINIEKVEKSFRVTLEGQTKGEIRYTLDGSKPTKDSPIYGEPLFIDTSCTVTAAMFKDGEIQGINTTRDILVHLAFAKDIRIDQKYDNPKEGDYAYRLNDGIVGSSYYDDGCYLGFQGTDADILIDLEEETTIHKILLTALQRRLSWIFRPEKVEIYASDDGKQFKKAATINASIDAKKHGRVKVEYLKEFDNLKTRYIKLKVKNIKKCPKWHTGAGGRAWIFLDEIIIQ